MYCSKSDIESLITAERVLELVDDEQVGSHTSTSDARITKAITAADGEINARIRSHYSVPLAPVPAFIKSLSEKLSAYNLFRRRASSFEMPEWLKLLRDDVKDDLKMLREGELDLGIEPSPAESEMVIAQEDGPDRVFTADTLENF